MKVLPRSRQHGLPCRESRSDGIDGFEKFRNGLLKASTKERGQRMLNMFHLTGFETIPDDFPKVLEETRKKYPAEGAK